MLMRGLLVAMLLSVGCIASSEEISTAIADDENTLTCSSMSCDYIVCDSCPVCGHPEQTCSCGMLVRSTDGGLGEPAVQVPCIP